ncbi:hypothetical protein PL11_001805 [Lentilactobacillus curieae]|uniref:Bacterial Ig domain-containing protein n=1 Tax=Lentilactobacillus curieae TaxID=1138822 RepID=A0A1S6QGK4_9LACO|nr:Ig-like domain-containing protein [Lentilactobacillus curieae]AQW20738.1 hypothetical protein PL11_001805 [Lentilactobacillus curieae]
MNKKQLVGGFLAGSLLLFSGVTVSAKKAVKTSVNKLTESSHYVTGKTTPKATVKISRKGVVYAYGKANSKGTFKMKIKRDLKPEWKYTVSASKAGYQAAKKVVPVAEAPAPAPKPSVVEPTVTQPSTDTSTSTSTPSTSTPSDSNPSTSAPATSDQPDNSTTTSTTDIDACTDPEVVSITKHIDAIKTAQQILVNETNDLRTKSAMLMQKYDEAHKNFEAYSDDKNNGTLAKLEAELAAKQATEATPDTSTSTSSEDTTVTDQSAATDDLASQIATLKAEIAAVGDNADDYFTTLIHYKGDADLATSQAKENDQKIADMTNQINDLYLERIDKIGALLK